MAITSTNRAAEETILQTRPPHKARGEVVSTLVSDFHYVNRFYSVGDVSAAMTRNKNISAIGVTEDTGTVIGIIVRSELFSLLGRPYGHEILQKRAIGDMVKQVKTFHHERNIFSVSEELTEELRGDSEEYFLLVDNDDHFAGIFTSRDLLIYLSDISQRDIAMARNLQRRIVKERDSLESDTFTLAAVSAMAKGVGGDFYYSEYFGPNRRLFMTICDVSGKGAAASLVTSALWGITSMYNFENGLTGFLTKLNAYLLHTFEGEKFVTGLFVDFDPATGEMTICDMGHSHLYLFRDGKLHKIRTNDVNPPLGVFDSIDPVINRVALSAGDIGVFITDGLIEQTNSAGDEYPITRFARHLEPTITRALADSLDAVMKDLTVFRGHQPQHDDVTISLLEYRG